MTPLWIGSAAAGSAVIVDLVRRLGRRALLDHPNERSSHTRPTPRGGGLGVVVPALAVWLLIDGFRDPVVLVVLAATTVATISWVDDRRGVRFPIRLAVHAGAATLTLWALGPVQAVSLAGTSVLSLGPLAWPLSLIWIVGLVNAYNFMDGIDGIAGGQALVAAAAWGWIGWYFRLPAVSDLGVLLAVTSLVFLFFNWSPAKIFLGDVGSAPLGFLFAVLPLLAARARPELGASLSVAGMALVWPFVFDASFTFLRRLMRREDVFAAHRSHLYQRMVIAGWSHAAVATLYIALAIVSALAGGLVVVTGGWALASCVDALLVPVILVSATWHVERRA